MVDTPTTFEYPEDREFFDQLLRGCGGVDSNAVLFDFRSPLEKRRDFQRVRDDAFQTLLAGLGPKCELACHPDCAGTAEELDHLIPLASNALNKQLREFRGQDGHKVPSQSFGSNAIRNLVLSCRRCNAFKKNKMPSEGQVLHVLCVRENMDLVPNR